MKKIMNYVKSFVIAAMVLTSVNVWGQTWTWTGDPMTNSSSYYILNVAYSTFLTKTDATVNDVSNAELFTLTIQSGTKAYFTNSTGGRINGKTPTTNQSGTSGTYYIDTRVGSGDCMYYIINDNWGKGYLGDNGNMSINQKGNGTNSDAYTWRFILVSQKNLYDKYMVAYATLSGYDVSLPTAYKEVISSVLGANNSANRDNAETKTSALTSAKTAAESIHTAYEEAKTYFGTVKEILDQTTCDQKPTLLSAYNSAVANVENQTTELGIASVVSTLEEAVDAFNSSCTIIPVLTGSDYSNKLVGEAFVADYSFTGVSNDVPDATSNGSNFFYTIEHNVTTSVTTGSADASKVIAYDAATKTITPLNAGTATITFKQNSTAKYEEGTLVVTVEVVKHANPITVNSSSAFEATLAYGDELPLSIVSANSANTIEVTQNSGEEVAVYENGNIVVNYHAGTATWTITQAENYKYKAGSASISATVTNATSSFCDMLNGTYLSEKNPEGNEYKIDLPSNGIGYAGRLYASLEKKGGNPKMKIYQYVDGNRLEIEELGGSLTESWKEFSYVLNPNATAVAFQRSSGLFNIHVKDVRVERLANITPSVAALTLPKKTLAAANSQATFDVDWSCSDGGDIQIISENAHFSVSPSVIGNTSCNGGKNTITVTYTSDEEGTHSGKIIVYNRTHKAEVNVSATTVGKLATTIVYKGAASYAVDAANMNANDLFMVVDANGNEVATPVLTLASSDAEKINVVSDAHAIDFLCGGSATITASYAGDETYAAAANVEQAIEVTRLTTDAFVWAPIVESYEVETEIPSLATANSGLSVTYTSDNESVIKIVDGKIMTIGKGSATLTAHTAGNCTWTAIDSEGKTINVHPHEQYIDWNRSFIDIVKNEDTFSKQDIALDALAKDMNGNNTDVNIIYSVPTDNGVATISDNTLHLIGDGTVTITATTADDSKYATVSITKEVRVRVYGSKCDSYLPVTGGTQKVDGNEKVWTWDNPTGDLVAPGTKNVTFHASVSALMAGRTLTVYQKIGEEWTVITERDEAPDSGSSKTIGCTVATNATGLKVQYTGTGWGSCTVSDVLVPMNSYIATVDASSFTGSAVAYNEITTNAVTIKYADVPLIEYEITDFINRTDDNTLDASSLTVTPVSRADLSNDCGNYGTYSFVISGTFNKVGTITANLRLHTSANDELKIPITLTINPASRTIHWDGHDQVDNTYPGQSIDLDAYCKTDYETPAGEVAYSFTQGSDVARIEGSKLYFNKKGNVTIKATPVESKEYTDPNDSHVLRSWTIGLLTPEIVTKPTITSTITYGDSKSVVTYNQDWVAKDVYDETVDGNISLEAPATFNAAGETELTFYFHPSDITKYENVSFNVPVTVNPATPSVTFPTTESTTYVADMTLDNINLIGGSATFNGDVAGTFAWKEPATAIGVVNNGSAYTVIFTPNSSNFKSVEGEAEIRITKATPEVTFPTTAPIKLADGLTLESVALVGGTASVAGKFAWDVPTTVLAEGTNSYSVTFTPTDAANYNTASSTVSVTVLPAKIIYDGTNWSHTPAAGDDVLISGDLVIDTDLKVNGMTIDNGVKVTLTVNGSLTVNGASDTQANYGDLIINAGGQVVLNDAANLQVRNLELNTELGNRETAAKSSQVSNAEKLHINGNAYIDITFDPVKITKGYYDFTVPFPVEAANGIYAVLGDSEKKLRQGTDYLLQNFSESLRATNVTAWKNFTGVLNPGKGYTIAINANHPEWNTIRFKKTSMSAIPDVREITLSVSASGNAEDKGWNCLGNGSLTHAQLEAEGISKLQIYDHTTNTYATFDLNTYNFAVGTTFRVQATTNGSVLYCNEVSNVVELRAPNRTPRENSEYCLQLMKEETMLDQIFLSASDDALNSYEIGHDLRKEGNPTSATISQIWSTAYNNQLSVVELPFEGNQAEFPISIFTPVDGVYNLQVAQAISDQQLYLTQNGYPIWNLSASPYSLYLMQGTTNEYGLLIVSSPKVATDINGIFGAEQAEKIIFNNQVYILRNGMIFDATGKKL